MADWTTFLSAMTLALVRVSGMVVFAPFFSSNALPIRTKAVFVGAVAFLLAPLVASMPNANVRLSFSALVGELGRRVGLWTHAGVVERDAVVRRPDRRAAVQLFPSQSAWIRLRTFRRR